MKKAIICAFVLWQSVTMGTTSGQSQAGRFQAIDSFTDLRECKQKTANQIAGLRSSEIPGMTTENQVWVSNPTNPNQVWIFQFRCLPEGTNPNA